MCLLMLGRRRFQETSRVLIWCQVKQHQNKKQVRRMRDGSYIPMIFCNGEVSI